MFRSNYNIAVLLPCYNEEVTISQTIDAFKKALPSAKIYVYDNNSTDGTRAILDKKDVIVHSVHRQGKGNVVRRMFADIEADIYVLCDADITYDATEAPKLIKKLVKDNLDMVVGARKEHNGHGMVYRKGHRFGNKLFTWLVAKLFGKHFEDILSGYRVFSYRFVKSFPALSLGFDIETELTIHALELRMPVAEILTLYKSRPEDSSSKLRSYRDGFIILKRIILMLKEAKPLFFFGIIALSLGLVSLIIAIPVFKVYFMTGLVPRLPTAILSTGVMVLAFLTYTLGIILHSISHKQSELKQMSYLSYPSTRFKNLNLNEAEEMLEEDNGA